LSRKKQNNNKRYLGIHSAKILSHGWLEKQELKEAWRGTKVYSYLKQKNSANPNMPMGGMPGVLFAHIF
jgi:hypothetical protein